MVKLNEMFTGWYDYNKKEFESILNDALISFDTNILLNFYKYSKKTSEDIFSAFKPFNDRIITSYYVLKEFTSNRKKVKMDNLNEYSNLNSVISKSFNEIKEELTKNDDKKINTIGQVLKEVESCNTSVYKSIENERKLKNEYYKSGVIEENIEKIFLNNFVECYDEKDFQKIKEEGLRRFAEQIPPGYEDAKDKDENGDYYIFRSLIDYCKKNKKDLIFVTNDNKKDWFREIDGIKEPREELLSEFNRETGRKLLIFDFDNFMKQKLIFKETLSTETVNEIKEINRMFEPTQLSNAEKISRGFRYIYRFRTKESIVENIDRIAKQLKIVQETAISLNDIRIADACDELMSLLLAKKYDEFISLARNLRFGSIAKPKYPMIDLVYEIFENDPKVTNGIVVLESIKRYLRSNCIPTIVNKKIYADIDVLLNKMNHDSINEEDFCFEVSEIYKLFSRRFNGITN